MAEPLVIVESVGTGHRLEYVSQVVRASVAAELAVTLITTERVAQSAEFNLHLGDFISSALTVQIIGRKFARTRIAIASLQKYRSAIVFLEADRRLALAASLSLVKFVLGTRRPVVALLMRPPTTTGHRLRGPTKHLLWRTANRLPRVRICALADCFGQLGPGVDRRWKAITDAPTSYAQPGTLQIHAHLERPTLLLGGMIDARKAPLQVAAGALQGSKFDVRIVGRVDPDTAQGLDKLRARYGARLHVDNRYVSNADLDLAIQESTIVSVVLTSPSGPSGMLARACLYGKPVLAGGRNTTVIEAVRARGLGSVATGLSPGQVGSAISDLELNRRLYADNARRAAVEMLRHPSLGNAVLAMAVGGGTGPR